MAPLLGRDGCSHVTGFYTHVTHQCVFQASVSCNCIESLTLAKKQNKTDTGFNLLGPYKCLTQRLSKTFEF